MLTARGRPEDVLAGLRGGRRRLPAEAVRAADPAGARPRPAAAAARWARARAARRRRRRPADVYTFAGHTLDLGALELRVGGRAVPPDADGGDLLRYLVQNAGKVGVAQGDPRGRLGPARGHRHARHRQLHRAAAPLPRRRPGRPRQLLTVRGVGYKAETVGASCQLPVHGSCQIPSSAVPVS